MLKVKVIVQTHTINLNREQKCVFTGSAYWRNPGFYLSTLNSKFTKWRRL